MPITTGNNAIVLDGPQAIEADDRRAASRFTLLIRAGKLVSGDLELPCVVRDASQSGIKLKVFNALPSDGPIDLELANGERFSVEPVWARDGHAGFRFTDDVDLPRLLDAERGPFRSRKLRLRTAIQGRVGCGSQIHPATLENISQQGAGIICSAYLAIDQLVRLETRGLPPIFAKVRWRREPHYGLIFEQTLSFEELARLVAE